jgi:hypothetical protein
MSTVTVYDSIEANQIPAFAQAAAGYAAGGGNRFPDFNAIVARFPHLAAVGRLLSYAVNTQVKAHILDMEAGDANPDQFPAWHAEMVHAGVWNPGGYASRDTWDRFLERIVERAGIRDMRRVIADWTGHPHIPPGYHMCQWTNRGPGGLNDDICLAIVEKMFPPVNHPGIRAPHGDFHSALVYDAGNGHWTVHPTPGQNVHRGGEDHWASVQVQLNPKDGHWRDHSMPFNAPPLGGHQ